MTQRHLAERNRTNAAKSTGPKTPRGKVASAQNARRHGATGAPEPSAVAVWLSVILDRPQITPRDLLPADDASRTALTLARAEAQLVATEDALAACEAEHARANDSFDDFQDLVRRALTTGRNPSIPLAERRAISNDIVELAKHHQAQADEQARRHRLLARYVREARAARSRAIADWATAAAEAHDTTSLGR